MIGCEKTKSKRFLEITNARLRSDKKALALLLS